MNNSVKVYEVLECKNKSGLTVGSTVLKPGRKFNESMWPYGAKALEAAVKNERCKLIEKPAENLKINKAAKDKAAKKLKALQAAYKKIDPKDQKAIKLAEEEIEKLKAEIGE